MEKIKGKSKMKEYKHWKGMKSRCYAPSTVKGNYKINEITVCDEWKDCFEQFYEDMGPVPEKYTLERVDNSKSYCKDNCIWADRTTQSKNRGEFNDLVTYNGVTKVLKDWAKHFNIKYTTLYQRIYRSGLSFEEAIQVDPFKKLIEINGESKHLKEWCDIYNIDFKLVNNRIHKHKWEPLDALTIPNGQKRPKIKI